VKLASLASEAATSAFHFHRAFTTVAGETPKQHTSRLALERAAAHLLTDRRAVLEIALESGFDSHEGFTRAFRRRFGLTPSAYRARGFAS
jgi:AraC family transcriptional regulator